MKAYRTSKFGFEVDLPDGWPLPTLFGFQGLRFSYDLDESFTFQISSFIPHSSLDDAELRFTQYAQDRGYAELSFDKIVVGDKEHICFRYYLEEAGWSKKFMLAIGGKEYAVTATCLSQETFTEREVTWDSIVKSFRLLPTYPDDHSSIFEMLSQPPSVSEMSNRVEMCERALTTVTYEANSKLWADLQDELARSLAQSPLGDRGENLEKAISHYQQALEVYTYESFPAEWALTHNNLGEGYRNRLLGGRAENLEKAIFHYEQALRVFTRQAYPEQWAGAQNNLAIACSNRVKGERSENVEQALSYFQQALEVYTRQGYPEDWASTQNNLGEAFRKRIRGERAENLDQAIHRYQQALEVLTRQTFPEKWAGTQNNLVLAYYHRIRGDRFDNLGKSIYHCQQALEVYTSDAYPEEWALTQTRLKAAMDLRSATQER